MGFDIEEFKPSRKKGSGIDTATAGRYQKPDRRDPGYQVLTFQGHERCRPLESAIVRSLVMRRVSRHWQQQEAGAVRYPVGRLCLARYSVATHRARSEPVRPKQR